MRAETAADELRAGKELFKQSDRKRVAVFGSARTLPAESRFKQVEQLGARLAAADYDVVTGGGGGIMYAANKGAGEASSFAVGITLPFEQGFNATMQGSPRALECKYFATRKVLFLRGVSAVVVAAGGYGTLDELFETLTLIQCGIAPVMPVVLLDDIRQPFWSPVLTMMRQLASQGLTADKDMSLVYHTFSVEDAVAHILKA